jgi:hypothetical protein
MEAPCMASLLKAQPFSDPIWKIKRSFASGSKGKHGRSNRYFQSFVTRIKRARPPIVIDPTPSKTAKISFQDTSSMIQVNCSSASPIPQQKETDPLKPASCLHRGRAVDAAQAVHKSSCVQITWFQLTYSK